MKLDHPELRTRLSAEYVLGTLRGGARRRFEEFLRSDYGLRQEVSFWESRLTPLAERIQPVTPPQRVWNKIEARIDAQRAAMVSKTGWLNGLALWRGLGLAASVLLVAMLVLKTSLAPVEGPRMMAVLEEAGSARMVIEQPRAGMLKARLVRDWKTSPDKSRELWVIPAKGAPRSLGLMNDQGETIIRMADLDSKLADGAIFAVTLEPKAGSGGSPTGPVLCKGAIARLPGKPAGQI
ncbi:MAG TPA: anti-sigma factor [Usitatibacteraceae bacterium]